MRLLSDGAEGVGYLLKDRVADVDAFVEAAHRVAGGGSALDPEVVAKVTSRAVERHVTSIFSKLGLRETGLDHRRVLAVLNFLER
jgi:DNA-binding NarL/FixJ family response regulator